MLNERLKKYREKRGWTQADLAERSGYSRSSIINWENGKRAPRTVDIDKLALVLGILPRDLVDDSPDFLESSVSNTDTKQTEKVEQTGFAYWGGVLDRAQRLAEGKNMQEISLIIPLLKLAYETLASVQLSLTQELLPVQHDGTSVLMPVNGGHHNKNTQNVNIATA